MYKPRAALSRLRGADDQWINDASTVEQTLWEGRQELWQFVPELPAVAQEVAADYGVGRRADIPRTPAPRLQALARLILKVGGPAGGVDGRPYEVYHHGVNFVAWLLAQAIHASVNGLEAVACVIGIGIDLLLLDTPKAPS